MLKMVLKGGQGLSDLGYGMGREVCEVRRDEWTRPGKDCCDDNSLKGQVRAKKVIREGELRIGDLRSELLLHRSVI